MTRIKKINMHLPFCEELLNKMLLYDYDEMLSKAHLVKYNSTFRVSDFDCGVDEYNEFITDAAHTMNLQGISYTQLLIDNINSNVIGYFCLCMSSITISEQIKEEHNMGNIPFRSIPALKVGKLAISEEYKNKQKGYGSLMIQLIRGIAVDLNNHYISCRFIVADVDVQYNSTNTKFYEKNGFKILDKQKGHTIPMYLDILDEYMN